MLSLPSLSLSAHLTPQYHQQHLDELPVHVSSDISVLQAPSGQAAEAPEARRQ
jgi:hypothetical protein